MSAEQMARQIEEILRRLDQLEATSTILYAKSAAGAYVPTYLGSTTAGVTTYVTQQGSYTRIGRVVYFTLSLQWTAATGTGNVRVSLPFAAAADASQNFSPTVYHQNVTFANSGIVALIQPTAATIRLFSPLTNAALTELVIEAAGQLTINGFYFV